MNKFKLSGRQASRQAGRHSRSFVTRHLLREALGGGERSLPDTDASTPGVPPFAYQQTPPLSLPQGCTPHVFSGPLQLGVEPREVEPRDPR